MQTTTDDKTTTAAPKFRPGIAAHGGPMLQIVMNVEQSRRLAHLAVRADQVMRRGLHRLGRGRLKAADFEFCARQVNGKIKELGALLEDVLVVFVPGEARTSDRAKHAEPQGAMNLLA